MKIRHLLVAALGAMGLMSCSAKPAEAAEQTTESTNTTTEMQEPTAAASDAKVLISTSEGDIEILLYGDTPKHQANFLKLAREGYYDGTLFHRVINEFMVQAGDPESKNAPAGKHLGAGGPGYQIDAEFVYPKHFHKRGALAAARTGDQMNPERKSSGSQFYIVTGKKYTDAALDQMEAQMANQELQSIFNKLAQPHMNEVRKMQMAGDREGLMKLQDELATQAEAQLKGHEPKLTAEQRKEYTTVGGTPFLDNQYTVFGEVISGMDVVDKIEKAATDGADRPTSDIKILSTKVIE